MYGRGGGVPNGDLGGLTYIERSVIGLFAEKREAYSSLRVCVTLVYCSDSRPYLIRYYRYELPAL